MTRLRCLISDEFLKNIREMCFQIISKVFPCILSAVSSSLFQQLRKFDESFDFPDSFSANELPAINSQHILSHGLFSNAVLQRVHFVIDPLIHSSFNIVSDTMPLMGDGLAVGDDDNPALDHGNWQTVRSIVPPQLFVATFVATEDMLGFDCVELTGRCGRNR